MAKFKTFDNELGVENTQIQYSFNYNVDGTINYIDKTSTGADTYRITFTYVSGDLTAISSWVKV